MSANKIKLLQLQIEECDEFLSSFDRKKQISILQGADLSELERKRYEKRAERLVHREDLDFYLKHREDLITSTSRIATLPNVQKNYAQDFALALARELRRCYDEGELPPPSSEDRGDNCFHSHIEHALANLSQLREAEAGEFARRWDFVRERSQGYLNLCNSSGERTNPDFMSKTVGDYGCVVIEAKFKSIHTCKPERDRYKGQQANYLSSECEAVILLAYEEPCSSAELKEQLCVELKDVFDMSAVAVAVVRPAGQDRPEDQEDEIDEGSERDFTMDSAPEDDQPLGGPEANTINQSADLIHVDNLGGDNRLQVLYEALQAEEPQDGGPRILDRCFFDVPRYMLEIRSYLLDKNSWLQANDSIPEMLAGGSTQMGKTMFVVIGVCVAKKLEAASVVITYKVAGRNSLAEKIKQALKVLNKKDKLGQLNPACMAYVEPGKNETRRKDFLDANDCIVISDTASQIAEARGSVYNLLQALQREDGDKGRFIVFMDEADSMLRTYDRRLRLEEAIDKLIPTTRTYHGAQLVVNISATLMPVFLEMARTKAQPRGPVFLTSVPQGSRDQYSSVNQFKPLKSADRELHPHLDEDLTAPLEVFLDPTLSRDPDNLGINKQVEEIFRDACSADASKKKALLLDVSLTRVYVAGSIFDKAEVMQAKFPQMHVIVYCGRGVVVRLARAAHLNRSIEVALMRQGKVLLPAWTTDIAAPTAGGRSGGAWYTTATADWGKGSDAGTIIGPGQLVPERGSRLARVDEVLNAIECVLEQAGRGDEPISVFGYTMMARGESFVTDKRVPSHLVLFMTTGASFDTLVQTAGRATFMRQHLLGDNGWVDEEDKPVVRVLMPEQDFKVIQGYPSLIEKVDEHVKGGKSLEELFGEDSVLKDIQLLQDFAASHRHGFGDKRKQFPTSWMGGGDDGADVDGESLTAALQRLQLPKPGELIWFDHAVERKWFECKVQRARFIDGAHDGDGLTGAQDVEYILVCTDRSIDLLADWVVLDEQDGNRPNWRYDKPDSSCGEIVHEPWVLQDISKIRKVVLELLRQQGDRWMTATQIEELMKRAADGFSVGGLSGAELRRCMREDNTLPGEALLWLSERDQTILRRLCAERGYPAEPLESVPPAKVQLRSGSRSGTIVDLSSPPVPGFKGPLIKLEGGTSEPASDFTRKPRAWFKHLQIVEWPVGSPLDHPIAYDDLFSSGELPVVADCEGLFEYRYTAGSVASAPSSQGSTSSPSQGRRSGRPDDPSPLSGQRRSSSRLSTRKRSEHQTQPDLDSVLDPDFIQPVDMRVIIDDMTSPSMHSTLIGLLKLSKLLSAADIESLNARAGSNASERHISYELRRACIDRCEPHLDADSRLKWQTFNGLGRQAFIHLCEENAVDYEGSNSKPELARLVRETIARKRVERPGGGQPSEHGR